MKRSIQPLRLLSLTLALAACGPDFEPDTELETNASAQPLLGDAKYDKATCTQQ